MIATEPAWKPQVNRSEPGEGDFWQKPAVRGTLRALSLVAGIAVAAVAFAVIGFWGAVLGCVGEETTGLCASAPGLVPVLEWPIVIIATLAPFAGGIATFQKRGSHWLVGGVMIAILMGALMAAVSTGQTGLLS